MWDRWKEASITKTSLRQTDRQTDSIYRASTASRGDKNTLILFLLYIGRRKLAVGHQRLIANHNVRRSTVHTSLYIMHGVQGHEEPTVGGPGHRR